MAQRTQLRLNAMSGTFGTADGKLNDQLVASPTGSVDADDLGEILSHVASAVKRIHGHDSFTEQLPGQFSQTIFPATDDAFDLGKASNAWKDLYLEGDVIISDAGEIKTSAGESFPSLFSLCIS